MGKKLITVPEGRVPLPIARQTRTIEMVYDFSIYAMRYAPWATLFS